MWCATLWWRALCKLMSVRMLKKNLTLSVQFADKRHREHLPRHHIKRFIMATLEYPLAEITVRFATNEEAHALNRDFRHKDYATNVLTFNYSQSPVVVADLVLCPSVIEAEALAQNRPLVAHYAHLLVHGTLHAQGYDHENEADAQRMEKREINILSNLGFDNPYAQ
jgi:probable rRNA maturation factor